MTAIVSFLLHTMKLKFILGQIFKFQKLFQHRKL